MSEPNNILPFGAGDNGRKQLPEENLMAYLEGRLSAAEQHEVEQWLADEGMESDALEGLSQLSPQEARQSVSKINLKLTKALLKTKRKRRAPLSGQTAIIAIAVILMLVVLAYLILRQCF